MKRLSPQQWHTMERVQEAGCPIDIRHLRRPCFPIQVFRQDDPPGRRGSHLYFNELGITLCMRLQISALSPVTLCGFRIEAQWLEQEFTWVSRCAQHPGYNCMHEWGVKVPEARVLTNRVLQAGTLERAESFSGVLLGQSFQATAPLGHSSATLFVQLLSGEELPFRLTVLNTGWNRRDARESPDGQGEGVHGSPHLQQPRRLEP